MKVTRVREFTDEDTTMTLRIIDGETYEGSTVVERLSTDEEGETIVHVTLETPSVEQQAIRSLEDLQRECEGDVEFDI